MIHLYIYIYIGSTKSEIETVSRDADVINFSIEHSSVGLCIWHARRR